MGIIKGLMVLSSIALNAFAFLMLISTRFQALMPEVLVSPNSPITALAAGALLLSIWSVLD